MQATGLKQHLMQEKAKGDELRHDLTLSEQQCKATEDDIRLVKRQLTVMTKARDVARQEREDWTATCNRWQPVSAVCA